MKVISTEKAPAAIGPYSQAIEIGGMLFASGQIPVDPATGEVPEGITAQAEQSCKNVGAILAEAGLGYENVVKTTCFLADMADFAATKFTQNTLPANLHAAALPLKAYPKAYFAKLK